MKKRNKPQKPIKLSGIDADILTTLRFGRDMYGLEMLDELNQERPIPLGFGSLYPVLNRLEKNGLIVWEWGDGKKASGGARRKYYKITGLGISEIDKVQAYRNNLYQRAQTAEGHTALGGI